MSRIFSLHVGTPKTATSLVQRHFASSGCLSANGIEYPVAGRNRNGIAHHPIAANVKAGIIRAAFSDLSAALQGSHDILISSEDFTNCLAAPAILRPRHFRTFLTRLCDYVDGIRVVIFLREASSFFESMYLHTSNATGLGISFDQYLSDRKSWYRNLFGNLRALSNARLPIELKVYAFQPLRHVSDWNDALGIDTGIDFTQKVNPRLSLKTQIILKDFDRFRKAYGVTIDRRAALRKFNAHDTPFQDDTHDFTLYRAGVAEAISDQVLSWAERRGCSPYVEAFRSPKRREQANTVLLDYAQLTPRDLTTARNFLLD